MPRWFDAHGRQAPWAGLLLPLLCNGEFIEDLAQRAMQPSFHVLFGATTPGEVEGEARLLSSNPPKEPLLESSAFNFATSGKALRQLSDQLVRTVRIYVHEVPRCAGEEVLRVFASEADGYGWSKALQLHAQHMESVHKAILNSAAIVQDPNEATVFYIPAFFGLLVERYIDTSDTSHLNCISEAWQSLPESIFHRNAGYDHFIVAGTCHPYSICSAMECDVTVYHPFAINVFALVGGVREIGHPDFAFTPGKAYHRLRTVFVPFPVTLDCQLLADVADAKGERPIAVAFVGSENSRVRHIFRTLMDEHRTYKDDPRLHVRVLPDDEVSEEARRAALEGSSRGPSLGEVYGSAEFCLVLPGHVYDLGRRAYDAMARGCIPVIVAMSPMVVAVPFAWQLPWEDFAVFATVKDAEDASKIIESLLAVYEHEKATVATKRHALLRHMPSLFLPPHRRCLPGTPDAVDSILRELAVRQAAWASMSSVRSPSWPEAGHVML